MLVAAVAAPAAAQDSRAERWKDQRREKMAEADAYEASWYERFWNWVGRREGGSDVPSFSFYGFQPVLGGLQTGAGTTVGLRYRPTGSEDAVQFSAAGRYSLRGYWGGQGILGYDHGRMVTYGYARYRHMPQEDFYGIGPNTPEAARTNYRLDEGIGGVLIGFKPTQQTFAGVHGSYLTNSVGAGTDDRYPTVADRFAAADVPGLGASLDYAVLGGWLEFDTRDVRLLRAYGSRFAPTQTRLKGLSLESRKGLLASVQASHYRELNGGAFTFSRVEVDLQQYVPFRRGYHVFALRQYGSFSFTGEGEEIPFYLLQPLGGVETVRGFDNFRFRDRNLLLVNAEYRWNVWLFLDLAVFGDVGHVFDDLDGVNLDDMEASYGLGFRFRLDDRVIGRLDFAQSREGLTYYVRVGSVL